MNQEYREYLLSPKWKAKRKELFALRGKKCEKCGNTKTLHIHHLNYIRIYKELNDDLQILCKICHKKAHDIIDKKKPSKIKSNKLVDKIGFGHSKPNTTKAITLKEYRVNKLNWIKYKNRKK